MSRSVPPSLAFYSRHPHDHDALGQLESRPEGISEADWQMYWDVMTRAGAQAGPLVTECRDAGISMLSSKVEVLSRCRPKTAAQNWFSWAEMSVKRPRKDRLKIWIGVGIAADPTERVWVVPYVSIAGGNARVRALARFLKDINVTNVTVDTSWFGLDNAPIELIPLREDSDLDVIVQSSTSAFRRLLGGIPQLAAVDF